MRIHAHLQFWGFLENAMVLKPVTPDCPDSSHIYFHMDFLEPGDLTMSLDTAPKSLGLESFGPCAQSSAPQQEAV